MRFFHLSDLHIGLRLMNKDLSEDQEYIFNEICRLAAEYRPDAVVIAGDIYDKAIPSAEAVALFDRFVTALTEAVPQAEIMMISGNHDSAPRVNVFRSVLSRSHIHMIGLPPEKETDRIEQLILPDKHGKVHFYLLPFVKPGMIRLITGSGENGRILSYSEAVAKLIEREEIDGNERNVLVAHQFFVAPGTDASSIERAESEIQAVGNVDAVDGSVLRHFDYAALGHIHKPMTVGDSRYRYSGTPIACSFSEAGQQKGIVLVELGEKGDVKTEVLPLKPKREVRVLQGTLEELLRQSCGDYISAVLTDEVDFAFLDVQDRLRLAFPNLLEIRRNAERGADYSIALERPSEMSPFELISDFLKDLTDEESELLRDVINDAAEVKE
ncbi:MAG: exonuclease SbcCD subunit D [Lachnospiraceae bacterium]|nr:exonuclease SbcCD subunit D [Lachnospiraceae bacterium]